ncbi:L-histidine N(alpha)-methyltransferase [Daejeonella lutea]|uniref:Dimethylhistidine N-methyltransferase n=1 Tax=Daejeonella lutea TaxID=572036 RepID=A0A1T5B5I1_9SPHI|nr:L-histidine N(alpha)-methyltransferase [Daejeonella lutea]SKB42309.1 dimethylhistidine N-methyltransferase [Daejeonella lutea]
MNTELHTNSNIQTDSSLLEKLKQEAVDGLLGISKTLPSKYLYDEAGDRLFQDIMKMPEYYLTDCELDIFKNRTAELSDIIIQDGQPFDLIELGAGDAMKSSFLLKHLVNEGIKFTYRPIDISGHILNELEDRLGKEIPELKIDPLAGEYFEMLGEATSLSARRKVVLFLGGNIGNMEWKEIEKFCLELNQSLSQGDMVLIGFDLRKNPHTILNAYNDKAGITAAFNLNMLTRLNRELGADFDTEQFQHYQTYDPVSGACRSYLVSLKDQNVAIGGTTIPFLQNEFINIEVSQKFSLTEIADLAERSGFKLLKNIQDSRGWFVDSAWKK